MRVAYITSAFPFGTAESFLGAEVRSLEKRVDRLFIVAVRPKRRHQVVELDGVAVRGLRAGDLISAGQTLVEQPIRSLRVLAALTFARYSPAAKLRNVAVFYKGLALAKLVREWNIDHIHAHWLTTSATVAMIAAEVSQTPWSCTAHRFDIFAGNALQLKADSAAFIRLISQRGRAALARQLRADNIEKLLVLPLGVEVPEAAHVPNARLPDGPFKILCAANLVPVKGHQTLVAALAMTAQQGLRIICDLAGDGPERSAIEAAVRAAGLSDSVHFRGFVRHDLLVGELAAGRYDAVVLTSIERGNLFEGIPTILAEAMGAGVPCIATRTGSIPELIDDTVGILVEQNDPAAVAGALETLAARPEWSRSLGAHARSRIAVQFNIERSVETLKILFEQRRPA